MPKVGGGRIAALEILKSTMRTREYVVKGETDGKSLVDAMRDGSDDGMQEFDGVLERMTAAGLITWQTALTYSTNRTNLKLQLADLARAEQAAEGDVIALASGQEKVTL
jgi:twitching motility protein PilT